MAAPKRTMDGRQRLLPLVNRLKGRGIRLKNEVGFFFATGIGMAASAFGIFLLCTAALLWLAPEMARAVPISRGQPFPNALVGSICLLAGVLLVILSRRLPYTILLTDRGLVLGFRSGRERELAWHQIDFCLDWYGGVRLLWLRNGWFVPILYENWPAWHDVRLLISFRQWAGPLLSPESPLVSQAFERFKLQIVGPGAKVPVERSLRQWQLQKTFWIYSVSLLAGLVFTFVGWVGQQGVLLGLAPLAIGIFAHVVLKNAMRPEDHIAVRQSGLQVTGRHVGETAITYAETKHWRVGPSELTISYMDKRPSIALSIQADDANMLIEAARIASQFPPLGTVVINPMAVAA